MSKIVCKALTFDDVLLQPGYSEVTPDLVDVSTWLTPKSASTSPSSAPPWTP